MPAMDNRGGIMVNLISRNAVCSGLVFLFVGALALCAVPVPVMGYTRAEAVDLALDNGERGSMVGEEAGREQAKQPDVKEGYINQQSYFFVAPANEGRRHSFSVGTETYSYDYRETVNGARFMSMKGAYSGLSVDYAYRINPKDSNYSEYVDEVRVQSRLAGGKVDYDGSNTFSGIRDTVFEMRGLLAKNYSLGEGTSAAPYIGLGYRYLNDGFEKNSPGGYNRESKYWYLPVGGDLKFRVRDGWGLSMNLEYDQLLAGTQKSHLEDVDPSYETLSNDQRKGYGIRGAVMVSKDITKGVNLFVEPFVRYWSIEDSDFSPLVINGVTQCDSNGLCDGGFEPSNVTKEIGLKMGVGF